MLTVAKLIQNNAFHLSCAFSATRNVEFFSFISNTEMNKLYNAETIEQKYSNEKKTEGEELIMKLELVQWNYSIFKVKIQNLTCANILYFIVICN